jgi:hypothetical protein
VPANFCIALEPIWIVECTAAYAENVRKSLEAEADGRRTFLAKVKCYTLSTRVRPVVVGLRGRAVQYYVLSLEYWFDQISGAGQSLAKGAVTNGYAHRLGDRPIANFSAKTSALMNDRHDIVPG